MRLPFDEDLDEVGCYHILSKAKKVLRRAGLCGEEDEIYLEALEGSEICVWFECYGKGWDENKNIQMIKWVAIIYWMLPELQICSLEIFKNVFVHFSLFNIVKINMLC